MYPASGTIEICSCSIPSVLGPYGGEITYDGACGDCLCTDFFVDINDLTASDDNQVYFAYQCCDGTFTTQGYNAPGNYSVCLMRVTNVFILFRGNFVPPIYTSQYTYGTGCGDYCNTFCGEAC